VTLEAQAYVVRPVWRRVARAWLEHVDRIDARNAVRQGDEAPAGMVPDWPRSALGGTVFFGAAAAFIALAVATRGSAPASGLLLVPVFAVLMALAACVAWTRPAVTGSPVAVRSDE
jgi:hypothetical protein